MHTLILHLPKTFPNVGDTILFASAIQTIYFFTSGYLFYRILGPDGYYSTNSISSLLYGNTALFMYAGIDMWTGLHNP